jgi:hypothetical protein
MEGEGPRKPWRALGHRRFEPRPVPDGTALPLSEPTAPGVEVAGRIWTIHAARAPRLNLQAVCPLTVFLRPNRLHGPVRLAP